MLTELCVNPSCCNFTLWWISVMSWTLFLWLQMLTAVKFLMQNILLCASTVNYIYFVTFETLKINHWTELFVKPHQIVISCFGGCWWWVTHCYCLITDADCIKTSQAKHFISCVNSKSHIFLQVESLWTPIALGIFICQWNSFG